MTARATHNYNHRRCTACGELTIKPSQRFLGGWFFIRCPNCQRQLRVDPQHGQRWVLLTAFVLIGAAAIAGAALTGNTLAFVGAGALACALLYVWEFLLTKRSPLEPVSPEEVRDYRRNWVLTAVATIAATAAVVFAATQILRDARVSALAAPNVGFLLRHPAHFVALGFGLGLAPVAPGTFGTLLAIPIAALLRAYLPAAGFVAVTVALALIGIWAVQVTGRDLGVPDHGAIVWDEVVAFLLVLFFVGGEVMSVAMAFVVFRFFDIVKPPPIRQLDKSLKNGVGVMADDLLAAGYTLLVLAIVQRVVG